MGNRHSTQNRAVGIHERHIAVGLPRGWMTRGLGANTALKAADGLYVCWTRFAEGPTRQPIWGAAVKPVVHSLPSLFLQDYRNSPDSVTVLFAHAFRQDCLGHSPRAAVFGELADVA
jgi:hypothetical protein